MSRAAPAGTERGDNPLSPPRGFCGAGSSSSSSKAPLSPPPASRAQSTSAAPGDDGRLVESLSAEKDEVRGPVRPLMPDLPRCQILSLGGWFVVIWLLSTLCLVAVILYVNLHNNTVANAIRSHMAAQGTSETVSHPVVHSHRARNVLVIVSVVLACLYIVASMAHLQYATFFAERLTVDLSNTLSFFESAACLRLESMPTCVCKELEMECVTERVQQFKLIPFSQFDLSRRAQIWMSEASVLLREFRSTLPLEVYSEFFSQEDDNEGSEAVQVQDDGSDAEVTSVRVASENDEARSPLTRPCENSSVARQRPSTGSVHGHGSANDECSLSATSRTMNSTSMRLSTTVGSSTTRRDHWRGSQILRSTLNRQLGNPPFTGTHSLENTMSTTQSRANFVQMVALGLKRRRATVLVVHFAGFQNFSNTSAKEAKKMSESFLKQVLRIAKTYDCSVAQCRADRITLCWNTFGRQRHKDHELLALECGQALSKDIQEELRRQFWRYNIDENFSMRVVVVGFTAPVLAGVVGPNRSVRIIHGNYISLCNELLSLLVYEQSRFAWVDEPPASLRAPNMPVLEGQSGPLTPQSPTPRSKPWTAIPFDTVEDELGRSHRLYEVSRRYSAGVANAHEEAYEMFDQGNFGESLRLFMKLAPEQNKAEEEANPIAARLRQLSAYYILQAEVGLRHSRPYPAWEIVPGDVLETTGAAALALGVLSSADASPLVNGHGGVGTVVTAAAPRAPLALASRSRRSDVDDLKEAIENAARVRRSESEGTVANTPRDDPHSLPVTIASDAFSPTNLTLMPSSSNPMMFSDAFSPINAPLGGPSTSAAETVTLAPGEAGCTLVATSSEVDQRPHISSEFEDKKHLHFLLSTRRLGETNSSEVFLGLSFTGQQVAIKSIRLIMDSGDEKPANAINRRRAARKGHMPLTNTKIDIDEVTREVQVLSSIRHDHIVGYITSVVFKDHLRIVMEYVSGGSLRDVMRDFKPTIEQARMYLNQILRGLRHLHKKNIVHCDIKPENVLVAISGPCKLTDFGISQQISKASSAVRAEGTPCYMAPEAAEGNAVLKSDIWSFGIMMVELLTGKRPWAKELHPLAMRAQLRLGTVTPEIQGEVSDEVRHIFKKCTQRAPEDRPSADELLRMPFFSPSQRSGSISRASTHRSGSTPMGGDSHVSDSFGLPPSSTDPEL